MKIKTLNLSISLQRLVKQPLDHLRLFESNEEHHTLHSTLGLLIVSMLVYGLVTGMFSGGEQLWRAPVKLLMGIILSALICYPSLYIFLCFSSLDLSPKQTLYLLTSTITLTAVLLLGFSPIIWVFAQSSTSLAFMGFIHVIVYFLSVFGGLSILSKIAKSAPAVNSCKYLHLWKLIFIFVSLQMTCVLRPIIGTDPTFFPTEKRFFISHWIQSTKEESARGSGE